MFLFSKKPAVISNEEVVDRIMQAIVEFASEVVEDQASDVVKVTLELDEQQRINTISEFTLNDMPKIPDPELINSVNILFAPFANLPEENKMKTLRLVFANGGGSFDVDYFVE